MLLAYGMQTQHPAHRFLRPLVANFAFRSRVMGPVVSRFGGVRASMRNAQLLVQRGELVAVFPEGLRGVGKLYRERYRLSRFGRGGFVRLARLSSIPIIPVAIVGAEEIHPIIGKSTRLAKPFGLPYIPVTPTFPFLGPLGLLPLPTKWTIQIGTPITPPEVDMTNPDAMLEAAEQVRARVDAMIAELLLARRSIFFG
jgi:1-acyl-sn-glycerol-3-phosphate acyltransferase